MTDFKVGDRVVYTGARECISPNLMNRKGTVVLLFSGLVIVLFDGNHHTSPGVYPGNLKLVEPNKTELEKLFDELKKAVCALDDAAKAEDKAKNDLSNARTEFAVAEHALVLIKNKIEALAVTEGKVSCNENNK